MSDIRGCFYFFYLSFGDGGCLWKIFGCARALEANQFRIVSIGWTEVWRHSRPLMCVCTTHINNSLRRRKKYRETFQKSVNDNRGLVFFRSSLAFHLFYFFLLLLLLDEECSSENRSIIVHVTFNSSRLVSRQQDKERNKKRFTIKRIRNKRKNGSWWHWVRWWNTWWSGGNISNSEEGGKTCT